MNRSDPEKKLESLHRAAQRSSNNLVELEIDPSRQLLDATRLEGRSAQRWAEAGAALTELWRRQNLFEDLLGRADRLQGARHAAELSSLLEGRSIELSSTTLSLSQRQLLDTARATEQCSADELVSGMVVAFDEVKRAIAELTAPWDNLTPRLEATRRRLDEVRQLQDELGQEGRADLDRIADSLRRLTTQLATDPLSVTAGEIDGLERELRGRRDELEEVATFKRGFDARIAEARDQLEQLAAVMVAAQTAHEELVLKVVVPAPPPPPALDSSLSTELEAVAEQAAHEAWPEASTGLKQWTARADSSLAEARNALEALRAPLEARNRLRALLEAYQVKARRLGTLEDRELQDIFARAQEVLYTAPCDLALAARLVRSYQIALTNTEATRRTTV